jgi:hypothetical protein
MKSKTNERGPGATIAESFDQKAVVDARAIESKGITRSNQIKNVESPATVVNRGQAKVGPGSRTSETLDISPHLKYPLWN